MNPNDCNIDSPKFLKWIEDNKDYGGVIRWANILFFMTWNFQFIEKYCDYISTKRLSEQFIVRFHHYLNWVDVLKYSEVTPVVEIYSKMHIK